MVYDFNDIGPNDLTSEEIERIKKEHIGFQNDKNAIIDTKYDKNYNKRLIVKWKDESGEVHENLVYDRIRQISVPQEIDKEGKKTMVKRIPDNAMKGFKEVSKQDHEYSIAIDFERKLEQPERIVLIKGGKISTMKVDDFELFGHTHPNQDKVWPSTGDVQNMNPLKPEFIIAGNSGKIAFFTIIDKDKWQNWKREKKDPYSPPLTTEDILELQASNQYPYANNPDAMEITPYDYGETPIGRQMFEDTTGVRMIPYHKEFIMEIKDDGTEEHKYVPQPSKHLLKKYHHEDD